MKPGDWVDGLNGIGKLISLTSIYADELDNLIWNKEIGSELGEVATYKVLCDFNGKLKKRIFFDCVSTQICKPIGKDSKKIIDSLLLSNPEEINNFESKQSKKIFGEWLDFQVPFNENLIEECERINPTMESFTFSEYAEKLKEIGIDIYSLKTKSVSRPYVTLSFFNENYKYYRKERIFTEVNCTLMDNLA